MKRFFQRFVMGLIVIPPLFFIIDLIAAGGNTSVALQAFKKNIYLLIAVIIFVPVFNGMLDWLDARKFNNDR